MNSIRLEPLSLMCGKIPHCPLHYYVQSILNFFGDLWFKSIKRYSPCVVNISLNITREKCMKETGQASVTDCEITCCKIKLWISMLM